MTIPRVSVVMPVYNGERYLFTSLTSLLTQSFTDFEIVIVDDGSTDATPAMISDFASSDSRIRAFTQSNGGVISALNAGLKRACGTYVAEMDHDDVAHPDRLAETVAFLDARSEVVAVGTEVDVIDEKGAQLYHWTRDRVFTSEPETFPPPTGAPFHPTVLMRADALDRVGGYRRGLDQAEDLDLFLRLEEIGKVCNLSRTLLAYRVHSRASSAVHRQRQARSAAFALLSAALRRRGQPDPLGRNGLQTVTFGAYRRAGADGRLVAQFEDLADYLALKSCRDRDLRLGLAERMRYWVRYSLLATRRHRDVADAMAALLAGR